jgi:hypothetical protein
MVPMVSGLLPGATRAAAAPLEAPRARASNLAAARGAARALRHAARGLARRPVAVHAALDRRRVLPAQRPPLWPPLPAAHPRRRRRGARAASSLDNRELLVGDALLLLIFALYKQLTAIILSPAFPGWLAPLDFAPGRFVEFFSFAATLIGTWVATGALTGAYAPDAAADARTALARVSLVWLAAMPVAAAQLILSTAAEEGRLVGTDGFAAALPLAASGAGEPFVTAAGVLGLMAVWRAFYAIYLDTYAFGKMAGARRGRGREAEAAHFVDALRAALALALCGCIALQVLGSAVGEERLEAAAGGALRALLGG